MLLVQTDLTSLSRSSLAGIGANKPKLGEQQNNKSSFAWISANEEDEEIHNKDNRSQKTLTDEVEGVKSIQTASPVTSSIDQERTTL